MPPKSDGDDRQRDFFGMPVAPAKPKVPSAEPKPKPPAIKLAKPRVANGREPVEEPAHREPIHQEPVHREPIHREPEPIGLHDRIGRLSPAELRELTAALTDDGLAQLTLATIRQLKRRLIREGLYGNKGYRSPLKRAAEQLVAEFGGQGEEDDF